LIIRLREGGSMTQRPEEVARVKNINKIEMGEFLVIIIFKKTFFFFSLKFSLFFSLIIF